MSRTLKITAGLIAVMALLAAADFFLGRFDISPFRQSSSPSVDSAPQTQVEPLFLSRFKADERLGNYRVASQSRASQMFERIDMKKMTGATVYLNRLEGNPATDPILLYEIAGERGKGALTYLNAKLQFINQINAATETLNETSEYGQNSFYYNDLNRPDTAFLAVQIADSVYAFQYRKTEDGKNFEAVKNLISHL